MFRKFNADKNQTGIGINKCKRNLSLRSSALCASIALALGLSSCGVDFDSFIYNNGNDTLPGIVVEIPDNPGNTNNVETENPNSSKTHTTSVGKMRNMKVVADKITVFTDETDSSAAARTYSLGDIIRVAVSNKSMWAVYDNDSIIGYCNIDGIVPVDANMYAELPVEYGTFVNSAGETVSAYSQLVDVAKYNDQLETPMIIDMILRTYIDSNGNPFYTKNICMLQYDAIQALIKAQAQFVEYGYTIKIYDAYRPTSVQQVWYDMVKVHKWVANPAYGDGGIHDRGIAVDISLVNIATGEELDFPTAMHTFSNASARSANMTSTQRANVDMMTNVMVSCGFTYINSEWWHFQLKNKDNYLPTDHPIDTLPLEYSE